MLTGTYQICFKDTSEGCNGPFPGGLERDFLEPLASYAPNLAGCHRHDMPAKFAYMVNRR